MKLGVLFAFVLVALVAFGEPAFAAKPAHAGKPAPSGTIAVAPGSQLYLGGTVTFDVTTADMGSKNPRIQLVCEQAGTVVYGEAHNVDGRLGPVPFDGPGFQLGGGGSVWKDEGGPAECVATLYYWDFHPMQTFNPLASVSFSAGG